MTGEIQLREKALALYGSVNGYEGAPTRTQLERVAVLDRDLQRVAADLDAAASKEVPALNAQLEKKNLDPLKPLTEDEWQKKQKD